MCRKFAMVESTDGEVVRDEANISVDSLEETTGEAGGARHGRPLATRYALGATRV